MSSDDNMRAANWAITRDPEVREVIQSAAKAVGQKLGHVGGQLDSHDENHNWIGSDVEQEALILVATSPELQGYADKPALLYRALYNDLLNLYEKDVRRSKKAISHDAIEGGLTLLEESEAYVAVEAPGGGYTRESVEELMPAIWDDSYCYGLDRKPNIPDPDMPRSKANPAHGNNLAAAIADIRQGWKRAELTLHERRALFLAYAVGWKQSEAAFNQGVSQQAISLRVQNGIAKILAHLNGGEWYEAEEQEEAA